MSAPVRVTSAPAPQTEGFSLNAERSAQAERILAKYPDDRKMSGIIPLLDLAQRENGGWLSTAAMDWVAEACGVAPMRVYEVASFYTMFYTQPVGKHIVQVCRTTPCWLRGSDKLSETCKSKLGIQKGETTADGQFTFIEVECLGACANAPMVQINDDYYEDLTPENFEAVLDALAKGEQPPIGSQSGRTTSEPSTGATTLTEAN